MLYLRGVLHTALVKKTYRRSAKCECTVPQRSSHRYTSYM